MIQAVVGLLGGLVREVFEDWRQGRQLRREIKKAAAEYRIEQAKSAEAYRREWELRALEGGDRWVRRLSFAAWTAPLVLAASAPELSARLWERLGALPEWYVTGYLAITAAIWGLTELRTWRAGRGGGAR